MACGHRVIWLAYARLQQGKSIDAQLDQCSKVAAGDVAKVIGMKKLPWLSGGGEDSVASCIGPAGAARH